MKLLGKWKSLTKPKDQLSTLRSRISLNLVTGGGKVVAEKLIDMPFFSERLKNLRTMVYDKFAKEELPIAHFTNPRETGETAEKQTEWARIRTEQASSSQFAITPISPNKREKYGGTVANCRSAGQRKYIDEFMGRIGNRSRIFNKGCSFIR